MNAPAVVLDPADHALVARSRSGDTRAYELLVLRYQAPMFRLALRMLGRRCDAEDVVQEVFLTAWRRLAQLQDDTAFIGWLYRTTTTRCLNALRARKPITDLEPDDQEAADGRPERSVEASAAMAALTEALRALTPEQRACWLLREVHGRSYDEIAVATRATATAVRGRIARARAELARLMAPWR